jgi:TonB-linked SusC/RagA family outer membrane protein
VTALLLSTAGVASAQSTLRGVVQDNAKQPLAGATVKVTQSSAVVTAGADGTFSVNAPQLPATIVVSYLGYKTQEVTVADGSGFTTVTLVEDVNLLTEVVTTALGISREKKSLGYATQEVKGRDIDGKASTNIINALAGKAAGVRVNNAQGDMGASRIVIRGETSIAGNNQPLFVVDGVPADNSQLLPVAPRDQSRDFRNAIADLNPEDIESLSVLKGPSAAALYGSRAAHGVVIITTKKGTARQKGLGINFNAGLTLATVATLPEFQDYFGQGANGRFSYIDGKGGGVNDGVDESWGPRLDVGLLIPQFHSNGQPAPWVSHPNNVRDFFETGITQDYGIAISNAGDNFNFRLGANYQDQKGTLPNTEIKKTNFTLNADYQLSKRVKVGANVNYIITDSPNIPSGGSPTGSNYRASSILLQFLWFGRQVDVNELKKDYTRNWNSNYYDNPYWESYYNTTSQERNRIIGNVHFSVNILEGLDFRFRTGTDYYTDRRKYKIKTGSSGAGSPDGSYAEDAYTVNENNTEALLSFVRTLSDDWSVDALAGFNVRDNSYSNNWQKATKLAAPDLYTLSNSKDPLESANVFTRLRVYSIFVSAQAGFRNFAYLNFTGRNDRSSTLPAHNRSYFYPSVTASLILSEALGIKSDVLSFLKLRGGWAEVGNDADPYQLATVYSSQTAFNGNPIQTSSKIKNNPDIRPERTQSTEIGAEVGLWNKRLNLDIAWYNTNSIDQILKVQTSAASGYEYQLINAGKVNNKGFEVQLNATPVKTNGFTWDVGINYAAYSSKVVELDSEGLLQRYVIGAAGPQIVAAIGERYGAIYGVAYQRDAAGNILVSNAGLPLKDPTNKVLGYYTPDWTGAFTTSLSYKGFTLSALIDASFGGSLYSSSAATGVRAGVYAGTEIGRSAEFGGLTWADASGTRDDGIIFPGIRESDGLPNNVIIGAESYYNASNGIHERYVYDASYIKLREVRLAYTFDKKPIRKLGLQDVTLAFVIRNAAILFRDKDLNMDPEVALNTSNVQGVEALTRPTTRSFGFSLNLAF